MAQRIKSMIAQEMHIINIGYSACTLLSIPLPNVTLHKLKNDDWKQREEYTE